MNSFYTEETLIKTESLIYKRFHTEPAYTHRLAKAALGGIASHGLDANDWNTVIEVVNVAVKSWVADGNLKNDSN